MAEIRRVWVVEEVPAGQELGQRQTTGRYALEGGVWAWLPPEDCTAAERAEWERVMGKLRDVGGEDLRHVVCYAGLLDHCRSPEEIKAYAQSDPETRVRA